jgi:hypothetical protein
MNGEKKQKKNKKLFGRGWCMQVLDGLADFLTLALTKLSTDLKLQSGSAM